MTNQERIAKVAVALDDSQDLYCQVLKTIREGQSEYIRRNAKTREFELSLNLRLQNQSVKLARDICEARNIVEYIKGFLDQYSQTKMEIESQSKIYQKTE